MLRRTLPVATVVACFVVALAASVFAAQAPAPAVQPASAPDQALAPAPSPDQAPVQTPDQVSDPGQCLPDSVGLPTPLLQKGNQTCDECLAYCDDRQTFCYDHCTGRDCDIKCYGQYLQCVDGCPC